MSIKRRITRIVQANRDAVKSAREDQPETADAAQQSQWQLLERVRRSAADLAAHQHRMQRATREAAAYVYSLEAEASAAVSRGDDDAARIAIRAVLNAKRRLDMLEKQVQETDVQARQLNVDLHQFTQSVQDKVLEQNARQAQIAATQAARGVQEALASAARQADSTEIAQRAAHHEHRQSEAQAQALEELSWTNPSAVHVQRAFEELETEAAAQHELDELKRRHNLSG